MLARMSESIQADSELLAALQAAGCLPGRSVRAALVGKNLLLGSQAEVMVSAGVAEHLFVEA